MCVGHQRIKGENITYYAILHLLGPPAAVPSVENHQVGMSVVGES